MEEKTNENELKNFEEFLNEFQTITKEDLIPLSKSNLQNLPKINFLSLEPNMIKQKTFKELPKIQRKKSIDISDSNQIQRIITKKKNIYFNSIELIKDENNDDIEILEDFRTDCILYDKNNKAYNGKLIIDQSYTVCFTGELNNKPLYFSSDYYVFPLLSISQCINNYKYFGLSNYCKELTLKDGRNFIFKFTQNAFEKFGNILEKFAFPKITKKFFNFAFTYKNQQKAKKILKFII